VIFEKGEDTKKRKKRKKTWVPIENALFTNGHIQSITASTCNYNILKS